MKKAFISSILAEIVTDLHMSHDFAARDSVAGEDPVARPVDFLRCTSHIKYGGVEVISPTPAADSLCSAAGDAHPLCCACASRIFFYSQTP